MPYTTAAAVGPEHARATWALAAREFLVDTARNYHAVTTHQELADFVQRRSLIRTTQQPRHWIGDVLARVASDCVRRGEPLLSALCVDAKGRVGASYATAVEVLTGTPAAEPDEHAAHERLACHQHFGATLPPGGGVPHRLATRAARAAKAPTRTPSSVSGRVTGTRSTPRSRGQDKPVVTCPVHFTVLPANGLCDLCE